MVDFRIENLKHRTPFGIIAVSFTVALSACGGGGGGGGGTPSSGNENQNPPLNSGEENPDDDKKPDNKIPETFDSVGSVSTSVSGETITVALSDSDNPKIQKIVWKENGETVSETSGNSFTIPEGKLLTGSWTAEVKYTDDFGDQSVTTNPVTFTDSAGSVSTSVSGKTITITLSDSDNPEIQKIVWKENGETVSETGGNSFTIPEGKLLTGSWTAEVKYTDDFGDQSVTTNPVTFTDSAGSISTSVSGKTITVTLSDSDNPNNVTIVWMKDGEEISGATGTHYTISDEDLIGGHTWTAEVRYADDFGTQIINSDTVVFRLFTSDSETASISDQLVPEDMRKFSQLQIDWGNNLTIGMLDQYFEIASSHGNKVHQELSTYLPDGLGANVVKIESRGVGNTFDLSGVELESANPRDKVIAAFRDAGVEFDENDNITSNIILNMSNDSIVGDFEDRFLNGVIVRSAGNMPEHDSPLSPFTPSFQWISHPSEQDAVWVAGLNSSGSLHSRSTPAGDLASEVVADFFYTPAGSRASGTSLASPIVAAKLSLLFNVLDNLGVSLKNTVDYLKALASPNGEPTNKVGHGYVELGDLLLEVGNEIYPILNPKALNSYATDAGLTLNWDDYSVDSGELVILSDIA